MPRSACSMRAALNVATGCPHAQVHPPLRSGVVVVVAAGVAVAVAVVVACSCSCPCSCCCCFCCCCCCWWWCWCGFAHPETYQRKDRATVEKAPLPCPTYPFEQADTPKPPEVSPGRASGPQMLLCERVGHSSTRTSLIPHPANLSQVAKKFHSNL